MGKAVAAAIPFVLVGLLVLGHRDLALVRGDEQDSGATTQSPFSPRDTLHGQVVDEQGQPVAGVLVSETMSWRAEEDSPAATDDAGEFKLVAKAGRWRNAVLWARTADGTRQAWLDVSETHAVPLRPQLQLKPARAVSVVVVDANQRPVAEATVEALAGNRSVALGKTNARGRASLRIAADAAVDWLLALKPERGFDYHENYAAVSTHTRGPLPADLRLVLDGARPPIDVVTVSTDGLPLPGVRVAPLAIAIPGKLSSLDLAALARRAR